MKEKSPTVRLALAGILGFTGAQRFYMGKWKTGILWLLTLGLLGVGWAVDLIIAAVSFSRRDKSGERSSAVRIVPVASAVVGCAALLFVAGIWAGVINAIVNPAESRAEAPEAETEAQVETPVEEPERETQAKETDPPETESPAVIPDPEPAPEPEPAPGPETEKAPEPEPEATVSRETDPEIGQKNTNKPKPAPEPEPEPEPTTTNDGGLLGLLSDLLSGTEEKSEPEKVSIDETVLLDESGIKITAKSLSDSSIFGPVVKLLVENNSDKDVTVQARNLSVNGYMIDDMMSIDCLKGKKANGDLTLMNASLNSAGIETISEIEFSFHVFEKDVYFDGGYLDTPQITLKTSAYGYEQPIDDSGTLAYTGNGIRIVAKGIDKETSLFGPSIVMFIENNSDKAVTVQVRDVSVNGFMIDPMFSPDIMPGKYAIKTMTFMDTNLEENGIEEIETVECSFHIFETNDWFGESFDTDPVVLTFN